MSTEHLHRTDRTVHASLHGRVDLARYARSGRWYVESPDGALRTHLGVRYAAAVADVIEEDGGAVHAREGGWAMQDARGKVGQGDRSYVRAEVLACYQVAAHSPSERINLSLAQAMSPQTLRDFVAENGGTIVRETDYRYTAEQGGDGEQGKLTVHFADRDGRRIGDVGFMRSLGRTGQPAYSAVDFQDLREEENYYRPERGGWIHKRPRGFVSMLAAMLPVETATGARTGALAPLVAAAQPGAPGSTGSAR